MTANANRDRLPLIGSPIYAKKITLDGVMARETWHRGILKSWHNKDRMEPVIEYQDGRLEALLSDEWK